MRKENIFKRVQLFLFKRVRISGLNAVSYERLWGIELNRVSIIFLFLFFFVLMFSLSYSLLCYTPLKTLLPDSAFENNEIIAKQIKKISQLENKVDLQTRYINDFKNVILGQPIPSDKTTTISKSNVNQSEITLNEKSAPIEKRFINKVEEDIRQNTFLSKAKNNVKGVFFFTPIKGVVSSKYSEAHPGIDIVAEKNTPVKATLDGIVVFSDWTQDNGYTIIIRHSNHFLSIYKHNSSLLKKQGDLVKAGDPIAIIGNTGENTTGTHLHFELLYEGKNVNPTDFISFQ